MAGYRKPTYELVTGDVIARPVFTRAGEILLEANAYLTPDTIAKIERWGVTEVFVKNPEDDPPPEDSLEAPGIVALSGEESIRISLGTLEPEEPIEWEEFAVIEEPGPSADRIEARMEEKIAEYLAVRAPGDRTSPPEATFVYAREDVAEAKKLVHEIHRRTVFETGKAVSRIARRERFDAEPLRKLVENLIDVAIAHQQVLTALTSLARFDDFLLAQAVGSTIHAVLTARAMGFTREELHELAVSCLLHDIGMSRIPPGIWKKTASVTESEHLEIQRHTLVGADLLAASGVLPFHAEIVAYQHHERFDGSGYPKGRRGIAISEYSRIAGLADAYTAMTSPRPHREKALGYDAMTWLLSSSSTLFDPAVVKAFLRSMSLYPIGSTVAISNGSCGIVVAANARFPYRPQIKVTIDEKGRSAGPDGDVIDLLKERSLSIVRAVPEPDSAAQEIWNNF